MHKFLLFLSVILIPAFNYAQLTDNFSDGDFSSNPVWVGDANSFKVNTGLQLQLNASGDGIATLSTSSSMLQDMEWNFWVKLSFSPSDNNLSRIYLTSNSSDLKGALSGYYIKLGETGGNDAIELVKQTGSQHAVICRGVDGVLANPFAIRIKVIRNLGGIWKIYTDALGGFNYQLQATGTDNTHVSGSYMGVYCKYTSSNSTKYFFDDFYAGSVIIDKTPPSILSVSLSAKNKIKVTFSEPLDIASSTSTSNYVTSPGTILPIAASQDNTDPSVIHLSYATDFTSDVAFLLKISNVKDLAGNAISVTQLPFSWHQVKQFDVLVNEIMADPSPVIKLPDAEYIELYNRSVFPVNLNGWKLLLGSTEKLLPDYILPAGGYLIVCDDNAKPQFESYGSVIDFSSFAIVNSGSTIVLKDSDGNIIHSISYSDSWYKEAFKKEGGWSLEMIDPLNPCGEASNWAASKHESGGTPGRLNSVYAKNPDMIPPAISRVGVADNTHITVWFTEICDSTTILNSLNYTINNGIGNPIQVTVKSPDYTTAYLTLAMPLTSQTLYTLTSMGKITDCAGNTLQAGSSIRFGLPNHAETRDIVINEILFDPALGCVDFVEVFNRSEKVVDLKECFIANYDSVTKNIINFFEISKYSYLILPGDYVVLSTDSAAIKKCYRSANPNSFINMASFPAMNNEDGQLAFCSKSGTVIDWMGYTAEMHYPLLTNVDGVSLERISPERASTEVTNWHSAAESVGFATPAYKNSQNGITIIDQNEITLSPVIFSPDNDGYNDNLIISYAFVSSGNNVTITIYDAAGRLVRNLVNHELCGTSGSFSWDGVTNDRLKASIGRYIVYLEIFDLQGQVKRYKKATVLGGRI